MASLAKCCNVVTGHYLNYFHYISNGFSVLGAWLQASLISLASSLISGAGAVVNLHYMGEKVLKLLPYEKLFSGATEVNCFSLQETKLGGHLSEISI